MSSRDELGMSVRDLLTGLETALPKGVKSLYVGNEAYSIPNLVKRVKEYDALWQTPEDLNAAFHASVQTRESSVPTVRDFVTNLKHGIVALMGSRNADLLKFGIEPQKDRRKLTGEERVQASAKARATRQKNGGTGQSAATPDAQGEKKPQA